MTATVPVITIDGPGGAGKGTLCKAMAETLGWHLLDSGAIYRVLALLRYIIMWMLNPKRRWCRWLRTWMFVLSPLTVAWKWCWRGGR